MCDMSVRLREQSLPDLKQGWCTFLKTFPGNRELELNKLVCQMFEPYNWHMFSVLAVENLQDVLCG